MQIIKRSLLYISRKKHKSITLFLTLCLVGSALISGIAVRNGGLTAKKTFSQQSDSMLHILPTRSDVVGDGYGSGEIPEQAIEAIAQNPNIEKVNNNLMAYAGLTNQHMVTHPNDKESYNEQVLTVYGNSYTDTDPKYTTGMITLKEGRHITPKDYHVMMVHEAFAKTNHLKLGDKLKFSRDPMRNTADKSLLDVRIIGIYKGKTAQKTSYPYEMLENTSFSDTQTVKDLYGYKEGQAFYRQSTIYPKKQADKQALKAAIKQQNIDWNKYQLTSKETLLSSYVKSIKVLNQLIASLQGGLLVVGVILVIIALLFWIGGRTHETGILLAIGKSKFNIIFQYALEVILTALPAFALSAISGQWIGQKLADSLVYQASRSVRADFIKGMGGMNLGADSETDMFMQTIKKITVQVRAEEIWLVMFMGLALVLFAIISTSLIIACYKPREILSKFS